MFAHTAKHATLKRQQSATHIFVGISAAPDTFFSTYGN